jgi:general secretion pathway protein K
VVRINEQKGVVLLLVIWVLAILMSIVLSLSYMTKTDLASTLLFKRGMVDKYIAEAGIERAVVELLYRVKNLGDKEKKVWQVDGTPYRSNLNEGNYIIKIMDESGMIDINTAPEIILRNLFGTMEIDERNADIIVDSILDWRDPDELHRLSGAESSYYMSLPNPYKAKNGRFDTVEELLLVRGITHEILYGNVKGTPLINLFTVNSRSGRINLKAAPAKVISALPGISPEAAEEIVSIRKSRDLKSLKDIPGIHPGAYRTLSPYISFGGTDIFTVESAGYMEGRGEGYSIRATVKVDGGEDVSYIYYKSPATGRSWQ